LPQPGKEPEDAQPGLMRESCERIDDLPFFHISTIVEMSKRDEISILSRIRPAASP